MEPAVSIRGLVKRFGDVVAVDGLSLAIAPGECFGLLGPNGAGKTTTIEVVEGLQPPTSGEVRVLGLSWDADARRIRERIGVQLQETVLQGLLSVRETLTLFASFYPLARPVADVLADVGLSDEAKKRVQALSGGLKQRLAIGCALVADPEILFLDEPTTGLDPAARRALWEVIRRYQSRGRTVVLTTHYMEEAERLCDRIAIMDRGRLAALGTPDDLVAGIGGEEVVDVATAPPLPSEAWTTVEGVVSARAEDAGARIVVHRLHVALPAILRRISESGAVATRIETHRATLDDVFIQVAGRRFADADATNGSAAK